MGRTLEGISRWNLSWGCASQTHPRPPHTCVPVVKVKGSYGPRRHEAFGPVLETREDSGRGPWGWNHRRDIWWCGEVALEMSWDGCARGGRRAGVAFSCLFHWRHFYWRLEGQWGNLFDSGCCVLSDFFQLCFPNLGARPLGREVNFSPVRSLGCCWGRLWLGRDLV